jgi:hypothetical protein
MLKQRSTWYSISPIEIPNRELAGFPTAWGIQQIGGAGSRGNSDRGPIAFEQLVLLHHARRRQLEFAHRNLQQVQLVGQRGG